MAVCVVCRVRFNINCYKKCPKLPRILSCSHNICEDCLLRILRQVNKIECPECSQETIRSSNSEKTIFEQFPLNDCLIGNLYIANMRPQGDSDICFPVPNTTKKISPKCAQCSARSDYKCRQCKATYCGQCLNEIHSRVTVMKGHDYIELGEICELSEKYSSCTQCSKGKPEFYCSDCTRALCSYCLIPYHKEHNFEHVSKLNEILRAELAKGQTQLSKVRMVMLRKSKEGLKNMKINIQNQNSFEESEKVNQHFLKLHSHLSFVKNKILQDLKNGGLNSALRNNIELVTDYFEETRTAVELTKQALKSPKSFCFQTILTHINEILEKPCVFRPEPLQNPPFALSIDESIFGNIKEHCQIVLSSPDPRSCIKLVEYNPEIDAIDEEKTASRNAISSVSISDSGSTSSLNSTLSSANSITTVEEITNLSEFVKDYKTEVLLSHLKTPSDFYVQKFNETPRLTSMSKKIKRLVSRYTESTIECGVVVAYCDNDRDWVRVQVMSISQDGTRAEIFLIDYGPTKWVPLKSLREFPPDATELMFSRGIAIKCKLANCYPKGGTWGEKAINDMCRIVQEFPIEPNVLILIVDEIDTSGFYSIHLYKQYKTFPPINVAEALVLYGSAFFNYSIKSDHGTKELEKFALHVQNNLDKFYHGYNRRSVVVNPKFGTALAAFSSEHNSWFRAEAVDVPAAMRINVRYVDYGNFEVLPYQNIKYLNEKFLNFQPQAYKCKLHLKDKVKDPKSVIAKMKEWDDIGRVQFRAVVKDVNIVDGKAELEVVLNCKDYPNICVNDIFTNEMADLNMELGLINLRDENIEAYISEEENQSQTKDPSTSVNEETSSVMSNVDSYIETPDGLRILVQVVKVVDPGEFYVTYPFLKQDLIELNKSLENYYNDLKVTENTEWKVKDFCAVKIEKWYRATIVEILDDDHLKVYLYDYGRQEVVEVNQLRPFNGKLFSELDMTTKCHLGGLVPAGSSQWSLSAKDHMTNFVNANKDSLYITRIILDSEEDDEDSLACDLLVKAELTPGPFEPSRVKWESFSSYISSEGLGRPAKNFLSKFGADGKVRYTEGEKNILRKAEAKFLKKYKEFFPNFRISNDDDDDDEEEGDKPSWPSPLPLTNHTFIGFVTNVSENGQISLYDYQNHDEVVQMNEQLQIELENDTDKPQKWRVGDMCCANFKLDKKWYRAKVEKIEKLHGKVLYLVRFIDFGNTELIDSTAITKPYFTDIPIVGHSCQLLDILPTNGAWETNHIDDIHQKICEHCCKVNVKLLRDGTYGINKLIMRDGKNLLDYIVSKGYATKIEMENAKIKKCFLPDNIQEFYGAVTAVMTDTSVALSVSSLSDQNLEIQENFQTYYSQYKNMENEMQDICLNGKRLTDPKAGDFCCALFQFDHKFYRGEIMSVCPEKQAYIKFIDYLNIELVNLTDVYELKEEWAEIPRNAIEVKLFGLNTFKTEDARKILSEALLEKHFTAIVKEKSSDGLLCVELIDKEGTYQKLVETSVNINNS